jgi:ElaB/YqjD/DUF883 family membrane-anchored ribosome-binding protein
MANRQGVTAQLPDQLQDTAEQAKHAAQEVAGRAQQTVRAQIDQRSTEAGETATKVSQAVRGASQQLGSQGEDLAAQLIAQAADRAEQIGQYLRESSADRIIRDVEDFGRQQPWAVILGGVLAGFAASRFLKASSRRRYDTARRMDNA